MVHFEVSSMNKLNCDVMDSNSEEYVLPNTLFAYLSHFQFTHLQLNQGWKVDYF